MSTLIPGIADPHYMDRKPRSRKDNFLETQIRKTRDVLKLCKSIRWDEESKQASALVIAGDICHQQRGDLISRKLDIRLLNEFINASCPVLAILGNHDKDRDRDESIEVHPVGSLVASKAIQLTHWPHYVVVGTDPPVIVTGRQYTVDGPGAWLDHLRNSNQLKDLKKKLSDEYGKKVPALIMTHCNWGPNDGAARGDPIIGYNRLLGTGIDVNFYGHPHSDDGIIDLDDNGSKLTLVGPGAFTRGTIAEIDVNRQPKFMIAVFYTNKDHEVVTVPIPHEPADKVFDLVTHARAKIQKETEEKFVQALAHLDIQGKSPEEVMQAAAHNTPAKVLNRAREYYNAAEVIVKE